MKKFFSLLSSAAVVLFFQVTAFSQITLTTADLANYFGPGKSWFQIQSSDTVMMNIGSASSSSAQTWSAPSVHYKDTLRLDNVLPSSTPYSANFPGATYAQEETMTEGPLTFTYYAYYKLSNDSLYILGSVQHESGSINGVKIDTVMYTHRVNLGFVVPVQVGEVIAYAADTIYAVGTDIDVNIETDTYDAYGTLTLPNGSFGAIREKIANATKVYLGGTLVNSTSGYTINWLTESGNQFSVQSDSNASGNVMVHGAVFTYVGTTPATLVKASTILPSGFTLNQNYPNPFNPSTQIQFSVPEAGFVTLKVYDMLGREVATLVNQELAPSSYSINWNAANVASGVYLYKLDAGNYSVTKKMVLMK